MPSDWTIESSHRAVARVLGDLPPAHLAFLRELLEVGHDHGQQLQDDRRGDVRHDAEREDRKCAARRPENMSRKPRRPPWSAWNELAAAPRRPRPGSGSARRCGRRRAAPSVKSTRFRRSGMREDVARSFDRAAMRLGYRSRLGCADHFGRSAGRLDLLLGGLRELVRLHRDAPCSSPSPRTLTRPSCSCAGARARRSVSASTRRGLEDRSSGRGSRGVLLAEDVCEAALGHPAVRAASGRPRTRAGAGAASGNSGPSDRARGLAAAGARAAADAACGFLPPLRGPDVAAASSSASASTPRPRPGAASCASCRGSTACPRARPPRLGPPQAERRRISRCLVRTRCRCAPAMTLRLHTLGSCSATAPAGAVVPAPAALLRRCRAMLSLLNLVAASRDWLGAQEVERREGGLHDVVRVGRAERLGEDVLHPADLEHGAHRAAGDDAGPRRGRLEQHRARAEAARSRRGGWSCRRAAPLRRFFLASSIPLRIADGHLLGLAVAEADAPLPSPTTTRAEKLKFLPPFTTLVTRLMWTT